MKRPPKFRVVKPDEVFDPAQHWSQAEPIMIDVGPVLAAFAGAQYGFKKGMRGRKASPAQNCHVHAIINGIEFTLDFVSKKSSKKA